MSNYNYTPTALPLSARSELIKERQEKKNAERLTQMMNFLYFETLAKRNMSQLVADFDSLYKQQVEQHLSPNQILESMNNLLPAENEQELAYRDYTLLQYLFGKFLRDYMHIAIPIENRPLAIRAVNFRDTVAEERDLMIELSRALARQIQPATMYLGMGLIKLLDGQQFQADIAITNKIVAQLTAENPSERANSLVIINFAGTHNPSVEGSVEYNKLNPLAAKSAQWVPFYPQFFKYSYMYEQGKIHTELAQQRATGHLEGTLLFTHLFNMQEAGRLPSGMIPADPAIES